jgi:type II secretory pathway component PulM
VQIALGSEIREGITASNNRGLSRGCTQLRSWSPCVEPPIGDVMAVSRSLSGNSIHCRQLAEGRSQQLWLEQLTCSRISAWVEELGSRIEGLS